GAPSHPSSRWRGLDRCVIGVLSSQNPDNATVEQFLGESTRPRALRATRLAHPALTRLTRGVRGPAPRGSRPLAPGTTRLTPRGSGHHAPHAPGLRAPRASRAFQDLSCGAGGSAGRVDEELAVGLP